jgi:hypothetical protein
MAALRALHPDRKARGYSQKDVSCATRKMGSALVFFAARLARKDVPVLQHALGRDRREVKCRMFSIDRIDLSAGFKLLEIAIYHDG